MSVAIAEDLDAVDRQATPSVTKALQLLDAFRHAGPTLGVSEIARLAGVPKSTAFRLLAYLEQSGFVEREGRDYATASPCVVRAACATSPPRTSASSS